MSTVYEFGSFTLDPRDRALRREGRLLRIAPKTFDLLLLFVTSGGQLLRKEDFFDALWKGVTVADVNLPYQIRTLRQALGDTQKPEQYIQTVTGYGYRFVAPVTQREIGDANGDAIAADVATADVAAAVDDALPSAPPARRSIRWLAIPLVIVIVVALATGAAIQQRLSTAAWPTVVGYTALTRAAGMLLGQRLNTDGTRVYFARSQPSGTGPPQVVAVAARGGGDVEPVWQHAPRFWMQHVSSRRSEALALAHPCDELSSCEVWILPLVGAGSPRRVGDLIAGSVRWSPDERSIAFTRGHDVYIARLDGSGPRKLASTAGLVDDVVWSPDGTRLRFTVPRYLGGELTSELWEVDVEGRDPHPLLPGWNTPSRERSGGWTPDGRYFLFTSMREGRTDLWMLPERRGWFSRGRPEPVQLTAGPMSFATPVLNAEGTRIFAFGHDTRGELVRYDNALRQFVSYLGGISTTQVRFTSDGRWVTFVSYPQKMLWRMRRDGSEKTQLTFAPFEADAHAWSPDGGRIAVHGRMPGEPWHIYLLDVRGDVAGSRPVRLTTREQEEGMPSWSADGTRITFGDVPPLFGHPVGTEAIHVYDLTRHTLTDLPGSKGLWTSRWSPDGRTIAALTVVGQQLKLFDVETATWRPTSATHVNDPTWSRDGRAIYFDTEGVRHAIQRLRVEEDVVNELTDLNEYITVSWCGLTPDDSPLMLRNLGTLELYALDLRVPN